MTHIVKIFSSIGVTERQPARRAEDRSNPSVTLKINGEHPLRNLSLLSRAQDLLTRFILGNSRK